MYQQERLAAILTYLKDHESMSVKEICAQFSISRDTARRDIVKLCAEGAAIRTHGGVALPELEQTFLAYQERLLRFSVEKMRIGATALAHLKDHGHYFFNASTVVSCMARQINLPVTVTTHGLDVAQILSDQPTIDLHLLGGHFHEKNRYFSDSRTVQQIESIHFDGAFLGAAAISSDGFYYHGADDAEIAHAVSKRSGQTIILAEATKFHQLSRYRGPSWADVTYVITDQIPDAETCPWINHLTTPIQSVHDTAY